MARLDQLQSDSANLFMDLLADADSPGGAGFVAAIATDSQAPQFGFFDPEHALESSLTALALSLGAHAVDDEIDGLSRSLDLVRHMRSDQNSDLLYHALALFVTHDSRGRKLVKPRAAWASQARFARSIGVDGVGPAAATEPETALDYWREDRFANEHHEHWHEVYPFSGLPPADWGAWANDVDRTELGAVFVAIGTQVGVPGDLAQFAAQATPQQLRTEFFSLARQIGEWMAVNVFGDSTVPWEVGFVVWVRRGLDDHRAYRLLLRRQDRQGELFLYMHEQMLARYDAERGSHGLSPVEPLDWTQPIDVGYDPGPVLSGQGFTGRAVNQTISVGDQAAMESWEAEIIGAVETGEVSARDGGTVELTTDRLGAITEALVPHLRAEVDPGRFLGHHNRGHMVIAGLSPGEQGVMRDPRVAIRDPIFWRWHKRIDNLYHDFVSRKAPEDFAADAPPVVIRDTNSSVWDSSDICLAFSDQLPTGDLAEIAEQAFGGDRWDEDLRRRDVSLADGRAVRTTTELTTSLRDDPEIGEHLTHRGFTWFLRLDNSTAEDARVTVRIFIAPEDRAEERRAWIEMDRFVQEVPAATKLVVARPDTLSSVVQKPAETTPMPPAPDSHPEDPNYCDCGWPWFLLLPRSTVTGSAYRVLVFLSDAEKDLVPVAKACGSMSFCGARDRYPDTREMGYPFARPFADSTTPVTTAFAELGHAAGTRIVIRHQTAAVDPATDPQDWVTPTAVTSPPRPTPVPLAGATPELLEAGRLIGAARARSDFAVQGLGLACAVLDTGINEQHVDFDGRIVAQRDFTGTSADVAKAPDGHGHGTNVAGIICAGADHTGIAPRASVAALKVLPDFGNGSFVWVREALQWVLDEHQEHDLTVVCMSLSDRRNHADDSAFTFDGIRDRIRQLRALRIPVVIAAGNEYARFNQQGSGYPGILRECVSVGAVYDDDVGPKRYANGAHALSTAADRLTPFSQRLHPTRNPDNYTRIFAPGAPIRASGIGGRQASSEMDGTSQATPVVAGTIMLLQEYVKRRAGFLPPVGALVDWLRAGSVEVYDGDDEHDNVTHTDSSFLRLDVHAALQASKAALEAWALSTGRTLEP